MTEPLPKCFILSVPKAGTYLMSEILKNCGLEQTYLHLKEDDYDDYKRISFEDGRRRPELARCRCPAVEALGLVGPGAFAVGHLRHTPEVAAALAGFKVVFLRRDLRDGLYSLMRFLRETGRAEVRRLPWIAEPEPQAMFRRFLETEGPALVDHYRALVPWLDAPGLFQMRFEDLVDRGRALAPDRLPALVAWLGVSVAAPAVADILDRSLGTATITKSSGGRSAAAACWDDWCEGWWREMDGPALMAAFGYV